MRSPSGPPIHPSTLLGASSLMGALLSTTLWGTLTTGHPLRREPGSFPLTFSALAFICLVVPFLAALPRRPGETVIPPVHRGPSIWLPWLLALTPLLPVSSELRHFPWLWPLLLLPLAALALAFLATRAHFRPSAASAHTKRYPPSASQSFGTAALTAAVLSMLLNTLLTGEQVLRSQAAFSLMLFFLVAVLAAQVFLAAAPALPPRFSQSRKPPMATSVFVWIAWPMALVSATPITLELLAPRHLSSLRPFGLFPLGTLVFAFLCTRAHLQERSEYRSKGEGSR